MSQPQSAEATVRYRHSIKLDRWKMTPAKSDVIQLGNQVGDNSPLYWNGRTYVWEDSAED